MGLDELNQAMADSNADARYGRRVARLTFAVTVALVAFLLYATVIDAPQFMFEPEPTLVGYVTGALGALGLTAGLTWMWRILRADRDPDAAGWRHHHRP